MKIYITTRLLFKNVFTFVFIWVTMSLWVFKKDSRIIANSFCNKQMKINFKTK